MAAGTHQKLKMLYLADILNKFTDEDNPLNAEEICGKLAQYGISAERKAIYNDIEMLILYGYDIVKTRTPRFGYFMASRELELPEIYMLGDAVRSADFITSKKTRELLQKLDGMLSISQAKKRDKGIYIDSSRKSKNEEIYYNIDTVNKAIDSGKKVSLKYCNRVLSDGKNIGIREKQLTISPYAMMWQNDHYYLVGNNEKYDNLIHLRLDRIKKAEVTAQDARPFSEVCEYTDTFDIADYAKKVFNMYGGTLQHIEFKCSKGIMEQILDRFTDNIMIHHVTETTFNFSTDALVSDGLVGFLLQFGNNIEVIKPDNLRDKIKQKIADLYEVYGK